MLVHSAAQVRERFDWDHGHYTFRVHAQAHRARLACLRAVMRVREKIAYETNRSCVKKDDQKDSYVVHFAVAFYPQPINKRS